MFDNSDDHFKFFAANLERAIEKYGDTPECDLLERQKNQVEKLVALEKEFRTTLIAHPWGPGVYKSFMKMICDERRNILAARPYFRERQEVFTSKISKALKKRNEKSLYKFHFNYTFILYVLKSRKWPKGGKIVTLAKQIAQVRQEIVEMNMPLAISRARIFFSKTPKAQLTFMDLVQISCEGLMSAVDKFVLPFSRVFRSVAIGRMVGNFIEQYSETLVHFFPVDKRKIYRANKLVGRFAENVDFEKLAEEVNRNADPQHHTNAAEIADLMAASSSVSADAVLGSTEDDEENGSGWDRFEADAELQPDVRYELQEATTVMTQAIKKLSPFEQKLLKLKGVTL